VSDPTQLPPIELELEDFHLLPTNTIWVRFQFDDKTQLAVEFPPDSPVAQNLLEVLERGASDMLGRIGQRGVKLTGFTPPEVEEEGP
jgi:hypothetical protein